MENFKADTYIIQRLFLVCEIDDENQTVTVIEKIQMDPISLTLDQARSLGGFIWECVGHINPTLPIFLKEHNIRRWFPARELTYVYSDESKTIEICYYQDQTMHDIVYKSDERYILEPNIIIKSKLDEIYNMYNLDHICEEIYAEE